MYTSIYSYIMCLPLAWLQYMNIIGQARDKRNKYFHYIRSNAKIETKVNQIQKKRAYTLSGKNLNPDPFTDFDLNGMPIPFYRPIPFVNLLINRYFLRISSRNTVNPISANLTKWSNTLKQFVGKLLANCLSMFDHFMKLVLKGLRNTGKFHVLNPRSAISSELVRSFI